MRENFHFLLKFCYTTAMYYIFEVKLKFIIEFTKESVKGQLSKMKGKQTISRTWKFHCLWKQEGSIPDLGNLGLEFK